MSSLNAPSPLIPADIEARQARIAIREAVGDPGARHFWRSLEEFSQQPEFPPLLKTGFPQLAQEFSSMNRRSFLRLMGASLALGGLTACTRQPPEQIVPFVNQPENLIPGQPRFYATAFILEGYGLGILAESHMGRPTKIEGNPLHPASLGGTDVLAQASILGLYDPDRSKLPLRQGQPATWEAFAEAIEEKLAAPQAGKSIRLLTGPVTSPTLRQLIEAFIAAHPGTVWHSHSATPRAGLYEATRQVLGQAAEPVYDFSRADVVLSLDADFLAQGPGRVRHARDFASRRQPEQGAMSRLYVVESGLSLTGAAADQRLALRPDQIEQLARALAWELGLSLGAFPDADFRGVDVAWVKALAHDLEIHRGRSLVLAGEQRAPALQALALAINQALGNLGATLQLLPPALAPTASLQELAEAMAADQVEVLLILEQNPVHSAPAKLGFAKLLARVPLIVHHGSHVDETAALAHWHLPATHDLEAWGDVLAYDGSASLIQPLIAPLYEGRSSIELLALLLGRGDESAHDLLKAGWEARYRLDEAGWRQVLHDGVYPASRPQALSLRSRWRDTGPGEKPALRGRLDVNILPDASVWDGRFANNAWLQELPRPLTTLTWENVLQISPATAQGLGLATGDLVALENESGRVLAPVLLTPGLASEVGVITLGYGRSRAGRVGNGLGFNATALQGADGAGRVAANVTRMAGGHRLALTQTHHSLAGRDLLRVNTVAELAAPTAVAHGEAAPPSLYPPHDYSQGPQWGMVIDLARCIGCNVCSVACQAENNIAVVGKEEVQKGRELHWMRVDRYFEGDPANPAIHHQPVTCMHCENAPCEAVCPVNATTHSSDGLNQMVYNQCVGSRYCSNNCPYKVRRFNFFEYADSATPSLKLQRNPDVTVRARGVMEKCTFCIQRISAARIEARKQGRPLADGEVQTACQQACPTQAIRFGDLRLEGGQVAAAQTLPRHYAMLAELGTAPRLTYLARVQNPNPALAPQPSNKEGRHGL